jgi:hypothetical protein
MSAVRSTDGKAPKVQSEYAEGLAQGKTFSPKITRDMIDGGDGQSWANAQPNSQNPSGNTAGHAPNDGQSHRHLPNSHSPRVIPNPPRSGSKGQR